VKNLCPTASISWPTIVPVRLTVWLKPVILWPMGNVLRLLRLFVLLRLATLLSIWAVLRLTGGLPGSLIVAGLLELASILFVWIPGLSRRLGERWYLAAALFLLITSESVGLMVTSSTGAWQALLASASPEYWAAVLAWRSESFFYLLVPVVLAAWAFERRGMLWASTWAVLTYLLGGLWLSSSEGALPTGYLTTLPVKFVILYSVSFLVAHLTTEQRRQHRDLEAAHAELKRHAVLTEQLATSRERNRLARELHDTLAHSLSGLSVQLQAADVLFDDDLARARQAVQAAHRTARGGLDEARRAIAALRASPLEDLGLVEALHRRLEALGERAGLETAWEVAGDWTGLNPVVEQAVYRVADEALLNAERHAAARRIEVDLKRLEGILTLTVHDDGQGFDAGHKPGPVDGHFGLAGMQERAGLAGGRLEISSGPQQGTTVRLLIEE
jgi:signal transduction histidine kinase